MFNVRSLLFLVLISVNSSVAANQTARNPLEEEVVAVVSAEEEFPSLTSDNYEDFECIQSNNCCNTCCEPWIYLDHVEGRWLDNTQGYTSFGLFLPLPIFGTSKLLPFVDLREHVFNRGRTAGNFGGGVRFRANKISTAFGVNAFFDYRKASWNHYFYQLGFGFEVLNPCCDFRVNTYLPIGERHAHSKLQVFNLGDGFKAKCRERRNSMYGYDVELGRWLKRVGLCDNFNLYGAVGFYSYFPNKHQHDVYGGEARLAARIGNYLSFEIKGGYDNVFHTLVQGRITLTIPFDIFTKIRQCCHQECCSSYDIACQPIYRQEIIPLSNKECCCTWNWDD